LRTKGTKPGFLSLEPPSSPCRAYLISPTEYKGFQQAYDFFNVELVGGSRPHVLVTLQRHARARDYFSPERFTGHTDENGPVSGGRPHDKAGKETGQSVTRYIVAKGLRQAQACGFQPAPLASEARNSGYSNGCPVKLRLAAWR
jgi:hypothetical protein